MKSSVLGRQRSASPPTGLQPWARRRRLALALRAGAGPAMTAIVVASLLLEARHRGYDDCFVR